MKDSKVFELIQGIIGILMLVEVNFLRNKFISGVLFLLFMITLIFQGIYMVSSRNGCKLCKNKDQKQIQKHYFIMYVFNNEAYTTSYEIKYCPICGRKIG